MFVFGGKRRASLGYIEVCIPVCDGQALNYRTDIVDAPIPMLLGLDVLDKYAIFANTVTNELIFAREGWSIPLVRKLGHVYLEWQVDALYTSTELLKIHRHFYHPHPDRIYNLMKKAEDPDATPETRRELEKVTDSCEICQRLAKAPGRLRVSLPNETIIFNRIVLMDLMTIEGQTVLHIVDRDTLFSAACFLSDGESTRDVWEAYLRYWVNPYAGYSDEIHGDQGPQFQSSEWKNLLQAAGIKQTDSGIESHNALGPGETYHEYLRQIFRKVRAEFPSLQNENALSIAVHAMNSTAGPSGLAPMLLVFGIVPRMPVTPRDLPKQKERMLALQNARSDMVKNIAKSRLSSARRMNVPRAVDSNVKIGMDVLVYRERPVNKWTGPFKVTAIDEKMVWINKNGRMSLVSIDKVKEFKEPIPESATASGTPDDLLAPTAEAQSPEKSHGTAFDEIIAADTFICRLGNAISQVSCFNDRS